MESQISEQEYLDLLAKIERAGMETDVELQEALEAYRISGESQHKEFILRSTEDKIWENTVAAAQNPFFLNETALKKAADGDFRVGRIMDNDAVTDNIFRLSKEDLIGGTGVYGWLGYGKSRLIAHLASLLMNAGIKVWLFDVEGEYRRLVKKHPELVVISVRDDKDNPLQSCSPKITQEEHIPDITEQLSISFEFRGASKSVVMDAVKSLMKEHPNRIPTLIQLKRKIDGMYRAKGQDYRKIGWISTVKNRLEQMFHEGLYEMCDCEEGIPHSELAKRSIVFDISSLSFHAQSVYRTIKLFKLFKYKQSLGKIDSEHVIMMDEIFYEFNEKKDWNAFAGEMPFLNTLMLRGRKYGIHPVVSSQLISLISKLGLAVSNLFCFRETSDIEINKVGEAQRLNGKQRAELTRLEVRECVGRKRSLSEPVKILIDEFELEDISEKELERINKPRLEGLLKDVKLAERDEEPEAEEVKPSNSSKGKTKQSIQSENQAIFISDVYLHFPSVHKERYQRLHDKMSQATAVKVKNELVKKLGYFEERTIPEMRGSPKYLLVKPQGMKAIKTIFGNKARLKLIRGKQDHGWIAERIKLGFDAVGIGAHTGDTRFGKEKDVIADLGGWLVIVEVVISNFDIDSIIHSLSCADEAWLITQTKELRKKYQEKCNKGIVPQDAARIKHKLLKEFI